MRAVNPVKWGPSAWALLHLISFNGDLRMQQAKAFVSTLREVLPCPACREHFVAHINEIRFPRSSARFARWMYDLHERVNASLGKSHQMSFKDVREKWQHVIRGSCDFQELDIWKFLLSIAEAHPGKQALTEVYVKASKDFWRLFADVLPGCMQEEKDHLRKYMLTYAIDEGVLVSRTKYREWVQRLYKEFEGRDISARLNRATEAQCTMVCRNQ